MKYRAFYKWDDCIIFWFENSNLREIIETTKQNRLPGVFIANNKSDVSMVRVCEVQRWDFWHTQWELEQRHKDLLFIKK